MDNTLAGFDERYVLFLFSFLVGRLWVSVEKVFPLDRPWRPLCCRLPASSLVTDSEAKRNREKSFSADQSSSPIYVVSQTSRMKQKKRNRAQRAAAAAVEVSSQYLNI